MDEYLDGIKYSLKTTRINTANAHIVFWGNTEAWKNKHRANGAIPAQATSQARIVFPSGHRHEYILCQRKEATTSPSYSPAEYSWFVAIFDKDMNLIEIGDNAEVCNHTFKGRSGAVIACKAHVEYHLETRDEFPLQPYLD